MDVILNMNFVLSGNEKDKLRILYNYLNQRVITVINTQKGSMLGDNLFLATT